MPQQAWSAKRERQYEHVKASLDAGADAHLSKPIRADALIEAIVHAMAGSEGREEAAA